jgi:F0F1-type ATP synthase membrane subunit b/b'
MSGRSENTAIVLILIVALIALMVFMWKFALKRMKKYIQLYHETVTPASNDVENLQ